MQWRQKRWSSWISYQETTCSIASNSGRFALSGVGNGEGSTLRVTRFLLCNFLNKIVLTSVRLFYSHTTYFAARFYIASNVKQGFAGNCYLLLTDIYKKDFCFFFIVLLYSFYVSFLVLYAVLSTLCVPYFCIVYVVFPKWYTSASGLCRWC